VRASRILGNLHDVLRGGIVRYTAEEVARQIVVKTYPRIRGRTIVIKQRLESKNIRGIADADGRARNWRGSKGHRTRHIARISYQLNEDREERKNTQEEKLRLKPYNRRAQPGEKGVKELRKRKGPNWLCCTVT